MKYLILAGALALAACAAPCPDEACQRHRDAAMAAFSQGMDNLSAGFAADAEAHRQISCIYQGHMSCEDDN